MAIESIKSGEIWVRITAGTRLRDKSVSVGDVLAVTAEEYVSLAAANKATRVDPPKPEPVNVEPAPAPVPAAKPAKAAKTENKK